MKRARTRNATSQVTAGGFQQSAEIFSLLADVLNLIGTRASAISLNGPLNHAQKNDLLASLSMIDDMKRECSSQVTKILRAARAKREN